MKVTAYERKLQGTGASRRLRHSGRAPGILYGGKADPVVIELDHNPLWYALKKEAFHGAVLEMDLDGKTEKVLLRDVQYHPYKPQVLHVDFQRVDANKQLTLKVPLRFSGEEESPAVKLHKRLVTRLTNELEIDCLPGDIPEFIAVDLSALEPGQTLHAEELTLPQGVRLASRAAVNPALVSVAAIRGGGAQAAAEGGEGAEAAE